ncbi:MAG: PH domain-containing protein [Alphaproteobacteria bacterium]|nr:PH domain-containing protein [Alphaproteobacteria bacterium]
MTDDSVLPKQSRPKKGRGDRVNIDNMLVKGEQVVIEGVIHWGIYWKATAVFIMAIFVALLVFELGVLLGIAALAFFAYAVIKKQILMLVLTNKRMFFRYGILQIDVVDMRFSKIESVEIERMPPGYLMGYSNVVIMGTGQRYVVIPYVANGPEIRQAYNRMTLADEELDKEEDE